jgi:hypothetical protein
MFKQTGNRPCAMVDAKHLKLMAAGFDKEEISLYNLLKTEEEFQTFIPIHAYRKAFESEKRSSMSYFMLKDKYVFQVFLMQFGIPFPKLHGLYHPETGVTLAGQPFRTAEDFGAALGDTLGTGMPLRLAFKGRGSLQGRQFVPATLLRRPDGTLAICRPSGELPLAAFLAQLPGDAAQHRRAEFRGWLVQDFLLQHPVFQAINPAAINTIRIVTHLTRSGDVEIAGSVVRFGRGANEVDAWGRGGVAVVVDPATGRLGDGIFKPKYGGGITDRHPDTGIVFRGQPVPYWPEVVALCGKAARIVPAPRTIGWDVALTPDGPVLLEGNSQWDPKLAQVLTSGYLTPARRAELAERGIPLPDCLPSLPTAVLTLALRRLKRMSHRLRRA